MWQYIIYFITINFSLQVCKLAALNVQNTAVGVIEEGHIYYTLDIIVKVAASSYAVS